MENKVLSQNIEQIKHFNSNLANEILMLDLEKSNIELAQNENGEYNILFNSTPLHSTISAINEAKQIVQNVVDKDNSIKIVFGFGLGYLADEFALKCQKSKVVVYEENIDILKYVFSIAQFDMFKKENVVLCTNKDSLADYIFQNTDDNTEISISFLNSYKNLYFEKIKEILDFAQNIQAQKIGDKNTFLKKAPACFYYTLSNLKRFIRCLTVSDIKDVYKGKTALIACAGPTLKENIEIIKQNKDKFVIFALNPTIRLLFENGITPDFIVAIESANISKQFEGLDCKQSYFINEPFVHTKVDKVRRRKTFGYISNDNFLNPWLRDCLKLTDKVETIGTVSYAALKSAFIMGFEKIILVGQDLAYKNGQCYSKECQYGAMECVFDEASKEYKIVVDDFEKFSKAFVTPSMKEGQEKETAQKRLDFLNKNLCTVMGQDGNYLPSQTGYRIFIDFFERAAKELRQENPKVELINSSIGGALIKGFKTIPLKEIVYDLETVEKLDFSDLKPNYDMKHIIEKIEPLKKDLEEYSLTLGEITTTLEKLIKELKTKNIFTTNAVKLAKKYTGLLSKLPAFKAKDPLNILAVSQLYPIEKYLRMNCFVDVETSIKILSEVFEEFSKIYKLAKNCHLKLSDCKSFIFEKFINI